MKQIIDETVGIAYAYLATFAFTKSQVETLVNQGQNELYSTLEKFVTLQTSESITDSNIEEVNEILHALQGLFFQMGDENMAEKLYEIQATDNVSCRLAEMNKLLGLQIDLDVTLEEACNTP